MRTFTEEFDNWYQHYPRKVACGHAEKAFAATLGSGVSLQTLIAGAKRYAAQVADKEVRYIKHPATWLNGKCWLDQPDPPATRELTWWQKRALEEKIAEERRLQM